MSCWHQESSLRVLWMEEKPVRKWYVDLPVSLSSSSYLTSRCNFQLTVKKILVQQLFGIVGREDPRHLFSQSISKLKPIATCHAISPALEWIVTSFFPALMATRYFIFPALKATCHSIFPALKVACHSIFPALKVIRRSIFPGLKVTRHSIFPALKGACHSIFPALKVIRRSIFPGLKVTRHSIFPALKVTRHSIFPPLRQLVDQFSLQLS